MQEAEVQLAADAKASNTNRFPRRRNIVTLDLRLVPPVAVHSVVWKFVARRELPRTKAHTVPASAILRTGPFVAILRVSFVVMLPIQTCALK